MKKITQSIKTKLLTPSQFADKKKVDRSTVHRHINAGKISIVQVGMMKDTYIDWNMYESYEFNENMKRN
jgi:predicted site-specific integrase-resolvase